VGLSGLQMGIMAVMVREKNAAAVEKAMSHSQPARQSSLS
jgi:hypothetical protein